MILVIFRRIINPDYPSGLIRWL